MRVLVVASTGREAAACGAALVCGSGERAREAVDRHLRREPADLVLIAGVCGGLDPSVAPGGLILARRVVLSEQPERAPGGVLFEAVRRALRGHGLPFISSTLLTVDRPVGPRAAKTELWNQYGAAGVDMETYGIVEAAEQRGVRWLALRAVLDPAGARLPDGVLDWQGEVSERAILRRLARRPLDWPAYGRLALQLQRALRALRQSVPVVVAAASSAPAEDELSVRESRLITLE